MAAPKFRPYEAPATRADLVEMIAASRVANEDKLDVLLDLITVRNTRIDVLSPNVAAITVVTASATVPGPGQSSRIRSC